MDARTLKALRASIEHWEENVAAKSPSDASVGIRKCALCVEFRYPGCGGCPVAEAADLYCIGTPYDDAEEALWDWEDDPQNEDARKAWGAIAQAELDFLKSLLPEGEG